MTFHDRAAAGRQLAAKLQRFRGEDLVVVRLPWGGVPVAFQVAQVLGAPLDVIVVRKLGVPFQPELAMGALGEGGVEILDSDVVRLSGISCAELAAAARREWAVLTRRAHAFRAGLERVPLDGKTVIVVDDGIATGATARAACEVARAQGAYQVVLAAPVGSPHAVAALRREADEVVCLETPAGFSAVGEAYDDFTPTTDEEVVRLLDAAERAEQDARPKVPPSGDRRPF